ncbi:MAG: tRNA (5-methylaminomethyl-2-thiouridine)(34)-methyltransferase MnmD [Francisella endosymbiont of Hyalomma scupense]
MEFAKIIWEKNTPKSASFNDFYFSTRSGIQESIYNFLVHNHLQQRFSQLQKNQYFRICEAGFGSGLNFILTMNLWHKYACKDSQLEFISFEKFPIALNDLGEILKSFDELDDYRNFLEQYNPLEGLNIYEFDNITLKLIIDDVNNINHYSLPFIDAWFLDGFAPSKNSCMWSDNLFESISKLCHNDSSFATFTASSKVRKTLQKYGFEVKKDKGFGNKREMMYGVFRASQVLGYA